MLYHHSFSCFFLVGFFLFFTQFFTSWLFHRNDRFHCLIQLLKALKSSIYTGSFALKPIQVWPKFQFKHFKIVCSADKTSTDIPNALFRP